ncbi:late competence protein ComER [Bacillus testis]|uniref:late competence protein ComER n=1 Tax=Bacillus testis TaxID=1622072 RepID=UPI00067F31AC|nr:late competence protein ComER [Bacillus testis]
MKVGVIGVGNMGAILAEALLQSKAIAEKDLCIINRTHDKAAAFQNLHPDVIISESIRELVIASKVIFVCVKPGEMLPVFLEIKKWSTEDQGVISITSPISIAQMDSILSCHTARWIPSITNTALSGVSLLTFGAASTPEWKKTVKDLAGAISETIEIDNSITRVASDIVSCGPAFFSFLAQRFIDAAVKVTAVDAQTAGILTEKMLIGFGDLLKGGYYSLPTLQEKVCVKGGITGEGINVLEEKLGNTFEDLFKATHSKFQEEIIKIEKQFNLDD